MNSPSLTMAEWVLEIRTALTQVKANIMLLFQALSAQRLDHQHILSLHQTLVTQQQTLWERAVPRIQQYLDTHRRQLQLFESLQSTPQHIITQIDKLQLLDDLLCRTLQTYPYTDPANIQDEFSGIITTLGTNAQNLTLDHLRAPGSKDGPMTTTVSLEKVLLMARKLGKQQRKVVVNETQLVTVAEFSIPAQVFETGRLIASINDLASQNHPDCGM